MAVRRREPQAVVAAAAQQDRTVRAPLVAPRPVLVVVELAAEVPTLALPEPAIAALQTARTAATVVVVAVEALAESISAPR